MKHRMGTVTAVMIAALAGSMAANHPAMKTALKQYHSYNANNGYQIAKHIVDKYHQGPFTVIWASQQEIDVRTSDGNVLSYHDIKYVDGIPTKNEIVSITVDKTRTNSCWHAGGHLKVHRHPITISQSH